MSAADWPLPAKITPMSKGVYSSMLQTTSKEEGSPSLIAVTRSSCKNMSVPSIKPVRRVEFDEDSIKATSPIRNAKPMDIAIPIERTLHRTDSEETIRPTPSRMRRTPSTDSISPAMDGNPPVFKSTSGDENSPTSPTMKGTHTLRRSTSMEKLNPTLRKMRSALSIKSTSPRASIKALQPQAISVLRAMCFFDLTDIREHYLTEICAHYSSHTGKSEATLSDFPLRPDDLLSALDELMKEDFISFPAYSLGMRVKDEVRKEILNQLKSMPDVFAVAFETAVLVLHKLWPSMMPSMIAQKSEPDFDEYAKHNLWGGRNELVKHVEALEVLFQGGKADVTLLCASTKYFALLVEAAWYYFERANYPAADQCVEAVYRTKELAPMLPRSLLANLYRTSAAIAFELGSFNRENREVRKFIKLYPEAFQQPDPKAERSWRHGCPTAKWALTKDAILESGLLAAAPDGVGLSPWGFDEVLGFPSLAPFLSLRYFGWLNHAEGRYDDAAKCFLQGLGDLKRFGFDDSVGHRKGELLYALGVVREAQKNDAESVKYFKRALAQFEKKDDSGLSGAKTHFKIALYYIHRVERALAELRLALNDKKLYLAEILRLPKLRFAELELAELSLAELHLADEHLAAASAFYRFRGNDNEYAPHCARVCLQVAQFQSIYGVPDHQLFEMLDMAYRYREKSMLHGERRDEKENVMVTDFDSEVVVWAR